ncbi:MAG TPA: tail fiber domain-containing protein [Polyangiales bacterium]|nr:tail fiber domain-containing protein [Polyangiales bacterium]
MGHARTLRIGLLGSALGLALSAGACPGETEIAKDPASGTGVGGRETDSAGSGSGAGQVEVPVQRGGGDGGRGGNPGGGRGGASGSGASGAGSADAGVAGAGTGGDGAGGVGGAAGKAGSGTVLGKCLISGCSNTVCADAIAGPQITTCEWRDEYACYTNATCARQSDGECGWTQTPELQACLGGGASVDLQWFTSCGTPVCSSDPDAFDSASIDNCTNEKVGDPCSVEGARCDGVATCGATLICASSDPQSGAGGCPRSRARYKQDIHYLDGQALAQYHEQVVHMPLASYRYKQSAEGTDQLGFIIEDVEPSAAVSGDRVNLYGYLSMAVAAIKVQQQQIDSLERELAELKETRRQDPSAAICAP